MKKLVSIAAAGFLLVAGIVFAQSAVDSANTNTAPVKKAPSREQVQEKRAELKDTRENAKAQILEKKEVLQEKRAEQKDNIADKRGEIKDKREMLKEKSQMKKTDANEKMAAAHKMRVEKIIKVLENRVAELNKFASRAEAHIAKLAAAGNDTTAASTLLMAAKVKVAEAGASVDGLYSQVEVAITSENQKVALQAVTTATRNTEAKLKTAHAAIVDVINYLKPGRNKANPAPVSQ